MTSNRVAIVVGTGGHARAVISILTELAAHQKILVLEMGLLVPGEVICNVPVVDHIDNLGRHYLPGISDIYLAIGDNLVRSQVFADLIAKGLNLPSLISPLCFVDATASVGAGTVVCHQSYVGPEARVGTNVLVNTSAVIEHEVTIMDNSHVGPAAAVAGRSIVGALVFLGLGTVVVDSVSIARRITTGAGTVVVKTLDCEGATYVGNPAKRLERT